MPRTRWISLVAGIVLAGALSACARREEPSATAVPASVETSSTRGVQQSVAGRTCLLFQ
jgi:hypothetical protein